MERSEWFVANDYLLGGAGLGEDGFRLVIDERVEFGVETFDAREVSAGHLDGGNCAAPNLGGEFRGG